MGNTGTFLQSTTPEPTPPPDLGVDVDEFNMIAAEAGFSTLRAKKLLSLSRVGDITKNLGSVKIGRSTLLLSDEQADEFIAELRNLISSGDIEPELKLSAIRAVNDLISNRIRVAKQLIASAMVDQTDGAKASSPIPSFLPRVQVVPAGHGGPIVDVAPLEEETTG